MLNMQNVKDIEITEGDVRTIHDKDNRLIWGRLAYDTKYAGDTVQNGTPTPDTPIPVQTVTGEQTVTISDGVGSEVFPISLIGKNLWNPTPYMTGYILNASGQLYALSDGAIWETTNITVGSEYTITATAPSSGNIRIHAFRADGTWIEQITYKHIDSGTTGSVSFVIPNETAVLRWGFFIGSTNMQLELGSTATSYVPYYNYELCKIGDYQDYIYNSGDDWYVHKATNKFTVTSSLAGLGKSGTTSNNAYYYSAGFQDIDKTNMGSGSGSSSVTPSFSDYFGVISARDIFNSGSIGMAFDKGSGDIVDFRVGFGVNSAVNTLELFKTWLDANELKVYYPLATATDTKITDATLVGQLNAVHEWLTRYGYNSTVTGNLPIIISKTNL